MERITHGEPRTADATCLRIEIAGDDARGYVPIAPGRWSRSSLADGAEAAADDGREPQERRRGEVLAGAFEFLAYLPLG